MKRVWKGALIGGIIPIIAILPGIIYLLERFYIRYFLPTFILQLDSSISYAYNLGYFIVPSIILVVNSILIFLIQKNKSFKYTGWIFLGLIGIYLIKTIFWGMDLNPQIKIDEYLVLFIFIGFMPLFIFLLLNYLKRLSHRWFLSLFLLMLILPIVQANNSSTDNLENGSIIKPMWWGDVLGFGNDHKELTDKSIRLVENHYPLPSKFSEIYSYREIISEAANQLDTFEKEGGKPPTCADCINFNFSHFYNPITKGSINSKNWASAYDEAKLWWNDALLKYSEGDKNNAYTELGYVSHLLQDASVPAHTYLIYHGLTLIDNLECYAAASDVSFENLVVIKEQDFQIQFNNLALKSYKNPEIINILDKYYSDGAYKGDNYYWRCKCAWVQYCSPQISQSDVTTLQDYLMRNTISYNAGLLILFYESTHDEDNDGVININDACPSTYGTYCHGCPMPSCGVYHHPICNISGIPFCIHDCSYPPIIDCDTESEIHQIESEWQREICTRDEMNACLASYSNRDTDKDGVKDSEDSCPSTYGTFCHGCPAPSCTNGYASCPPQGAPYCIDYIYDPHDSVSLSTNYSKIYFNDSLSSIKNIITKNDFTLLENKSFSGNMNTVYEQVIDLGTNTYLMYLHQPTFLNDPTLGFSTSTSSTNYMYNSTIIFSGLVNFTSPSSKGKNITFFGKNFTISTLTNNHNLVLENNIERITLLDGSAVTKGSSNSVIDGTKATLSGGLGALSKITISVYAPDSDKDAILPGQEFIDPVFGSFKLSFSGLSEGITAETRDHIVVDTDNTANARVTFTSALADKEYTFNYAHDSNPTSTAAKAVAADSANKTIHVLENETAHEEEYIIINSGDDGRILEVSDISVTNNGNPTDYVIFTDIITGEQYQVIGNFISGLKILSIGSEDYNVWANSTSVRLTWSTTGSLVLFPRIKLAKGGWLAILKETTMNVTGRTGATFIMPSGYETVTSETMTYSNKTNPAYGNESVTYGNWLWVYNNKNASILSGLDFEKDGDVDCNFSAQLGPVVLFLEEKKDGDTYGDAICVPLTTTGTTELAIDTPYFSTLEGVGASRLISWSSDTYKSSAVDKYGTYVVKDTATGTNQQVDIYYPDEQMYADIYLEKEIININCYQNSDCGTDFANKYCNGNNACETTITYTCNNPGTEQSYCTNLSSGGCHLCSLGCNESNFECKKSAPTKLIVNSPKMNISDNKRVLLDLKTTQQVDEITYEDLTDKNPRERRLCSNCNSYDREKSFNDGNHSIIFRAIKDDKVADEENVSFFIDSKSPRISTTKPSRRKYTNGSDFYLKYTEDNCQSLKLEIQGYSNSVAYAYACESGKNIEKTILQNLSAFNGETIEYTFTITDIAENTDSKTVSGVYVDTSPPVLNNPDSFWTRGEGRYSNYIYFDMSITEKNFDEVVLSYDYRGKTREKRLCSRLKDGKCEYKFKLSDAYSNLRLIIRDEAGNSAQEEIDFGG